MAGSKIKDLFIKDPSRYIDPVVMVDRHEQDTVSIEVEEYIVTPQIRDYLQDIIDRFLESRTGSVDTVCAWISGFFGSGKSHFLKMLGFILSDKKISLRDAGEIRCARYFGEKYGITGTHILASELNTKVLFVNMLHYDRVTEKDLSRYIYRILLRELGFSDIFWVAQIEQMLKKKGLWDDFVEFVETEEEMEWKEIRRIESRVRSAIVRGLMKVDPKAYPDIGLSNSSVEDVQKEFTMNPEKLAQRLVNEAEVIDKDSGRVVLLLDEVGLALATERGVDTEKLTELNALAEQVEKIGNGKVWIFATAQEALEEIVPKVEVKRAELEWIKDRFRIKAILTPANITTVVKKRLLDKDSQSSAYRELKQHYENFQGSLSLSARLKDPARDPGYIYTKIDPESFIESYPLLPYHLPLMVEIFGVLRSRGRASPELTGRERTALGVARSAVINLLEEKIAPLITFDMLYDAISEELKAVRSEHQSIIEYEIPKLGISDNGMKVSSVAKALFLLQQVGNWIPCSIQNISSVLYPKLGMDQKEHQNRVESCLRELVKNKWIIEEESKYRFLSQVERTFEDDIEAQRINPRDIDEKTIDVFKELATDLKKYTYKNLRTFDIHLFCDNQEISTTGHIRLRIYTPRWFSKQKNPIDELYSTSAAEDDTLFWISGENEEFERKLERVIAIHKTLEERMRSIPSPEEVRELERYRREVEITIKDELPGMLRSALRSGTILYQGDETKLDGKATIREVFGSWMKHIVDRIFTEFEHAATKIPRDSVITEVLSWQGGTLSPVYTELKLIDKGRGLTVAGPTADRILREIKRRVEAAEECSGRELVEHFEDRPYGWDPKVVRLVTATLFKNGSIQVEHESKVYSSAEDSESHRNFSRIRSFNKTKFHLGATVTGEQKRQAASLISEFFALQAGITPQKISETIDEGVSNTLHQIQQLKTTPGFSQLPIGKNLDELEIRLKRVEKQPTPALKILEFLKDEVRDTLNEGIPFLKSINQFIEKDRLSLFLSIRRFADRPLSNLINLDESKEISERKENLERRLTAKTLTKEWENLYEDFSFLRKRYENYYHETHRDLQRVATKAIEDLIQWCEVESFEKNKVEKELKLLRGLLCSAGDAPIYDNSTYLCSVCQRELTEMKDKAELVQPRAIKAKDRLLRTKPISYDATFSEQISIGEIDELRPVLTKANKFIQYWLKEGKKIRFSVKGERVDE